MKQSLIIDQIQKKYPDIELKAGQNHYWSPNERTVYFNTDSDSVENTWALLHETGHAILNHIHYFSDLELLKMELQAWEKAKEISASFKIEIDEDHIQDCLDSYRDWLYKRSLCPDCSLSGIQISSHLYSCIFCNKKWKVSAERFCRPYRKSLTK